MTLRVVGLGGSLTSGSTSLAALKLALASAESAGARTSIFDLAELDLPMYAPGAEPPRAAVDFADATYAADGVIWSSPMYHGTVSGAFKNAIDWLQLLVGREPAYLTNKVVGLISTAGGIQGLQAVNTMEFIVRALRGWAVPLVLPIPPRSIDRASGEIQEQVAHQLDLLAREVVRAASQFARDGRCDYSDEA